MAALLVGLNIMALLLTLAMPIWKTVVKREKEAELIWRGQQYARAITLFQRKYANAFPPNVDILLNERFLRKKYKDPMTKDGEFQLVYAANPGVAGAPGQIAQQGQPGRPAGSTPLDGGAQVPAGARGGIMGVVSKSTDASLRLYNGRSKYNEWAFVSQWVNQRPGAPGAPPPPGQQRPGPGIVRPGGAPGTPGQAFPPGMPQPRPIIRPPSE